MARGDDLGPLHGVPFTIKDSFDTAGVVTTQGSRLFGHHVPAEDATAVARMRAAGLTRNPWDLRRTPGGSSALRPPRSRPAVSAWAMTSPSRSVPPLISRASWP
ncbi:amidase family protein [Streptomyces afghaniensis]|uniref:amidase family protein n=1 Tax=Streptomyces afghaniensis TaxID=66865 RepID=UPI0037D6954F